jgi:hypothetical protein
MPSAWFILISCGKPSQLYGFTVIGYRLISSHVHLVVVPHKIDSLAAVFCHLSGNHAFLLDLVLAEQHFRWRVAREWTGRLAWETLYFAPCSNVVNCCKVAHENVESD